MMALKAVVLSCLVYMVRCELSFPPGFKFGAATSSYQIEGAWNVSDKTENIWDRLTHTKQEHVADRSDGDIACDSYHRWREDIDIAADLGLHFYRFSISWARLLPSGFPNRISEDGQKYYSNLIDRLLEKGIEPLVTIYHWDLPQSLQDLGGWTNPLIAEWFADYARVVYSLYADRVKTWITINEPLIVCEASYNVGRMAPSIRGPEMANYLCNKNILIAHAKAWRIYDEEFKPKYHGKVSLSNALLWVEPETNEDNELAELVNLLCIGMYSHAIFSEEGGWPPAIEKIVTANSKRLGYSYSKLPAFTKKEIELVKGTHDFYAFNYYIAFTVRPAKPGEKIGSWPFSGAPALNAVLGSRPEWNTTPVKWFSIYPDGFRKVFLWLRRNYGDLEYMITENGYASQGSKLDDKDRIQYLRDHMKQLLLAVKDGVNVTRYTVWTLIDNFEWLDGYNTKFGLYEVDFSSPERTRIPRASAQFYKSVIRHHALNEPFRYYTDEL